MRAYGDQDFQLTFSLSRTLGHVYLHNYVTYLLEYQKDL